jgi:hypothetical protein
MKGFTMKKINLFILASALMGSSVMAMSSKVQKPEIVRGTTLGTYKKPGAPIDIDYRTQHIQAGDESVVDIRLITSQKEGRMDVKVELDGGLTPVGNVSPSYSFKLDGSREYPLHFKVIASSDGVYYIRLLVQMGSKGFRAFAVPVYVGNGTVKLKRMPVMKSKEGERISVMPAQETIIKK